MPKYEAAREDCNLIKQIIYSRHDLNTIAEALIARMVKELEGLITVLKIDSERTRPGIQTTYDGPKLLLAGRVFQCCYTVLMGAYRGDRFRIQTGYEMRWLILLQLFV